MATEEYMSCCRRKERRGKNSGEWKHGKLEEVME
jgi:hypothetical protein